MRQAVAETNAMPQSLAALVRLVKAALDGVFGTILGLVLIPVATRIIGPVWEKLSGKAPAGH